MFRVRLRRMTSKNSPAGYPYRKNVNAEVLSARDGAQYSPVVPGLLRDLSGCSEATLAEENRRTRVGRATRGYPVLVCNPGIFFCIFYFLYGLVSMTHHTAPAHCVSMTPSVELRGYIPAGTRPSLHTDVYSVKYFLFLLTISVIYLNIVTWVVSYTVYSHKSVQLRL